MIIHASITYKNGGISPAVNDIKKIFNNSNHIKVSFRERTPVVDMSIRFTYKLWLKEAIEELFVASLNKKALFCDLLIKGICDYIVNLRFESKTPYIVGDKRFDIKFTFDSEGDYLTTVPCASFDVYKIEETKYHNMITSREKSHEYSGAIMEINDEWKLFMKHLNDSKDFDWDKIEYMSTPCHEGDEVYDMILPFINEILLIWHCSFGESHTFYFKSKRNEEYEITVKGQYSGMYEEFIENERQ